MTGARTFEPSTMASRSAERRDRTPLAPRPRLRVQLNAADAAVDELARLEDGRLVTLSIRKAHS